MTVLVSTGRVENGRGSLFLAGGRCYWGSAIGRDSKREWFSPLLEASLSVLFDLPCATPLLFSSSSRTCGDLGEQKLGKVVSIREGFLKPVSSGLGPMWASARK